MVSWALLHSNDIKYTSNVPYSLVRSSYRDISSSDKQKAQSILEDIFDSEKIPDNKINKGLNMWIMSEYGNLVEKAGVWGVGK